jgi:hypothetical protein
VVAGPDGYLCVLPAGMEGKEEAKLFKGHVGDVLDVKFFPSGEVRPPLTQIVGILRYRLYYLHPLISQFGSGASMGPILGF